MTYALPTNVNTGTTGHAALHNATNAAVNEIGNAQIKNRSGLRDITSLLANGWTANGLRILRSQDITFLMFSGLNGSASTSVYLTDSPLLVGFTPSGVYRVLILTSTGAVSYLTVSGDGRISAPQTVVTASNWQMACIWAGSTDLSDTLPGTAM